MNKSSFTILSIVLVLNVGCDNTPASFGDSIPLYTLTTQVSPKDGGTVQPSGGDFTTGDGIEIEAHPANGYVFERWENDLTGNINPGMLFFSSNRTVKARFLIKDYDLNIEISGGGFVRETVSELSTEKDGADSVNISIESVLLTAEAENGWIFDRWEGDINGGENPVKIDVVEQKNVSAIFGQKDSKGSTLTINNEGEGSVDIHPERNFYSTTDEVILTANASSGWSFIKWQGDLSGSENSKTVKMKKNIVATALFEPVVDYSLEILHQPSATIAGTPVTPSPELKLTGEDGTPVDGIEVKVSVNKHSFASGSSASLVTNAEGIAVFNNLMLENAATDYILTFNANAAELSDLSSKPFKVVSADADLSSSSADVPDGSVGERSEIFITINDRFDNKVEGLASELNVIVTGSNNSAPDVKEKGGGKYTARYTPTQTGTDQVVISYNGKPISGSPFRSEVGVGLPAVIDIVQQPATITAGKKMSFAPAVQVTDNYGNKLENVKVTVKLDGVEFANGSSVSIDTNSEGVATFNNLMIYSSGTGYTLTFQVNDLNKTSDSFDVNAAETNPSTSIARIPNGTTGEPTIILITCKDSFGNPTQGTTDGLSVKVKGSNSYSPYVKESTTTGKYSARYIPVSAGNDQIEIQYNGKSIGNSPFTSIVNAADANTFKSSVSANPAKIKSAEYATIKVQPRDNNGNPIGGLTQDDFDIKLSGNAINGPISQTSTAGSYEFEITSNSVGEVSVIVTVNGITLTSSPVVTFEAGEPHEIIIISQPENTLSGMPVHGPPAVRINDESGQGVSGVNVQVRELDNYKFSASNLIVSTNQSGIAEFENLVIHSRNNWFTLVFSIEGLEDLTSEPFRILEAGH